MKHFALLFLACVLVGALASLLIEGELQPDALRGGKYSEVCSKPENGLMCGVGSGPFNAKCKAEPRVEVCTKEVVERQQRGGTH